MIEKLKYKNVWEQKNPRKSMYEFVQVPKIGIGKKDKFYIQIGIIIIIRHASVGFLGCLRIFDAAKMINFIYFYM